MLKKYKIFVCLLILLGILLSFVPSVFASTEASTEDNFTFVDFYGEEFSLPPLNNLLDGYNHYIIYYQKIIGTNIFNYYVFPFNETIEINGSGSTRNVICDGKACDYYLSFDNTDTSWRYGTSTFQVSSKGKIIYSCPCLQSRSSELKECLSNDSGFFINRQEVLVPIVERTSLTGVMKEIVEILPVVLVTLVGLIGLRKALRMLSAVLHRS